MNLTDLAHRTLWTFLEALIAVLIAAQVIDLAVLHGAAIAAGAAALVPIKEYARLQLQS
jgi:hypothetical protein